MVGLILFSDGGLSCDRLLDNKVRYLFQYMAVHAAYRHPVEGPIEFIYVFFGSAAFICGMVTL